MKFQSSIAFEKHLQGPLAPVYLLVSPCDYEKRLWVELLKKKESGLQVSRFDALEVSLGALKDEVCAPNLWGGRRLLFIDHIDKLKPLASLLGFLNYSAPDVVLVFGAAKPVAELYQYKELVALDVSEEKPWDRERRLQEWLREEARKEEKQLPTAVAAELIGQLGTDLATLHQELKKLIIFAGERPVLETKDVEEICGSKDLTTGWQLAEELVWRRRVALQDKMSDLGFVFPFLGQVRYHLQLGAQLSDLIERKIAPHELKKHFPSVRPQNLDKFIPVATKRGSRFFLNGLLELYELELLAKSSSLNLGTLFDRFQCRVHENAHFAS